jgi:antitoxin component of RelBE/YafQ-DinJ toxin-antitoxin module
VSDAVRILLTRTANEGALPFALSNEVHDALVPSQGAGSADDPRPAIPHKKVEARSAKKAKSERASIEKSLTRPTLAEFRERLHRRTPVKASLNTARLVRQERDKP